MQGGGGVGLRGEGGLRGVGGFDEIDRAGFNERVDIGLEGGASPLREEVLEVGWVSDF
jgi:hypothetical protein